MCLGKGDQRSSCHVANLAAAITLLVAIAEYKSAKSGNGIRESSFCVKVLEDLYRILNFDYKIKSANLIKVVYTQLTKSFLCDVLNHSVRKPTSLLTT